MNERLSMILTPEELKRISKNSSWEHITVDLHKLTVERAQRLIKNLIALDRSACEIIFIHGYNRGTSLKRMLNNEFTNPRLLSVSGKANNPGITIMQFKAAA